MTEYSCTYCHICVSIFVDEISRIGIAGSKDMCILNLKQTFPLPTIEIITI